MTPQQITQFQNKILGWYAQHKRDLPWRHTKHTNKNKIVVDPYTILISEVMSQQTQITRVISKYQTWMQAFPTIEDLAKASTRDVLFYWSGLGYNRRALFLRKCAEAIVSQGGVWPQTEKELLLLPGIGKYTARALLCFAFGKQIAVVDTNVRKVILTQIAGKSNVQLSEKEIENIAQEILPFGKASEWNQALMDYAATILKKEKIPVPKQSKFIDSDRYYRGYVIRLLLSQFDVSSSIIIDELHKQGKPISESRMERILQGLKKDHLITYTDYRESIKLL